MLLVVYLANTNDANNLKMIGTLAHAGVLIGEYSASAIQ